MVIKITRNIPSGLSIRGRARTAISAHKPPKKSLRPNNSSRRTASNENPSEMSSLWWIDAPSRTAQSCSTPASCPTHPRQMCRMNTLLQPRTARMLPRAHSACASHACRQLQLPASSLAATLRLAIRLHCVASGHSLTAQNGRPEQP